MSDQENAPRTVFAPNPGGRRPPSASAALQNAMAAGERRFGVNPLVDAAGPLFELAVYLRGQGQRMDAQKLRDNVTMLLREFEIDAREKGCDPAHIRKAHYALCATIDDVILASPWGFEAEWQRNPLVSMMHGNVKGGDEFFDIVQNAQQDPQKAGPLIELLFICLSLGFRGRYWRDERSLNELEHIRMSLYQQIDRNRGGVKDTLSLRWKGEETRRIPPRAFFPVWLAAGLACMATALLFAFGAWRAGEAMAQTLNATADLPPGASVEIERAALTRETVIIPDPEPEPEDLHVVMRDLLKDLEEEQVIDAPRPVGSRLVITVRSVSPQRGVMFDSARAEVKPRYREVLHRIAEALSGQTDGAITVRGHSDLEPLNPAHPLRTNQGLSEKRAENAALLIADFLAGSGREIFYEGVGEAEPLEQGDSPATHARNRRIDVTIPYQSIKPKETSR